MEGVLFQTSLVAAFVAGMVALFAPCCITFLLPAYLGSVFKEKEKILLMTLVFGLGIFIVLLPAVLGVALISQFLFHYHDLIYIVGGLVMLVVAITTFLGLKMPMPHIPEGQVGGRTDVLSIFTLGVVSGITSACCAPVLVGILTLTFLSPSFFGGILVGAVYVLGMVTPLLLMSIFLQGKMPRVEILRKPIAEINLFGRSYPLILSNIIAATVFLFTGVLALYLTLTGQLAASNMDQFARFIKASGDTVASLVGGNILVNILFVGLVVWFIYQVSKKV